MALGVEEMRGKDFEEFLNEILGDPDNVFKKFLSIALKLWDYRKRQKRSPYGVEYLFQTYIVEKLLNYLEDLEDEDKGEYKLYFSESIKKLVDESEDYENKYFYQQQRCVQPDLVLVKEKKIVLIMEIKCIENGCLNWVLSNDGREDNECKGDIAKLRRVKKAYPEILCYELIVNRGRWDSDSWGNKKYEDLKGKGCIREVRRWDWEFDGEKALSAKLVEIGTCQS